MAGCSDKKNPLKRSGTSQQDRTPAALQADYVQVDERNFDNWIVFAAGLSAYINYYDESGKIASTWEPFFTKDISAILGQVAVLDADTYRREIKARFDYLKNEDNAADTGTTEKKLNELFSAILTIAKALDEYVVKLPDEILLKATIKNLIQVKLSPALQRLIGYHKAADSLGYLTDFDDSGWKVLNKSIEAADDILAQGLKKDWWAKNSIDWNDYLSSIKKDESIFGDTAWIQYRRINHAANHNLFSSVFDQFLMAYTKIVDESEKQLLQTLDQWDTHPAHYALFLSFLKLFRFAQTHINTLTYRHLDFYYKEVLQLHPKAAIPNQAHILVELAKQVDGYLLDQGTKLKAGKDSAGKDVIYSMDEAETFNKAKVAALKSVYLGNAADKYATVNNLGRLFASPVANSADGKGAELTSANKEWHPFVNRQYVNSELTDIVSPNAQIGFAVASHYLFLTEGERKVYVRIQTNKDKALHNLAVDCYLTTEKEWYKVSGAAIVANGKQQMSDNSYCAELSFTLPGDAPAIVNYDAAVHLGTFNCKVPVLKVYLKNEDSSVYQYNAIKNLQITKTEIKVEVGKPNEKNYTSSGLKQLLLSNDFGPLDAAKPFQPFGAQPKKDATFVVGNKEVFSKNNAKVKLNFEWANLPSDPTKIDMYSDPPYTYGTNINFLNSSVWKNNKDDSSIAGATQLFNESNAQVAVFENLQPVPLLSTVPYGNDYPQYNSGSVAGFMRFVLRGDFGHKLYLDRLTEYLIDQTKASPTKTKPVEPYSPTIQSLYISYTANTISEVAVNTKSNFDKRELQFFHLAPFGEAEQHSYLSGKSNFLVPQFNHIANSIKVNHIGEFFIGLENLKEKQSVNILFQVLEGSTDPLTVKPDDHISWAYLSNNQWVNFDSQQVSDGTKNLIQSGIISFIIPEGASTTNTILPTGYLWIKAGIASAADAICKLLAVSAQAAVVTFEPDNNAADFLNTALPASTISKLKIPDASVKKIEQPFSSFGGRPVESDAHYYIRSSERLRHKSRAITIWDYEHLVLEAFPEIHKVKCLNHTKIEDGYYNEVLPGNVSIITIPALINRSDVNPLKPYTNQSTLTAIEDFLKQKVSCHVKVYARQPQFEEVRMSFKLRLMNGFDDFTFYSNKLKEEITQYLTPWAYSNAADIQFGGKIYKSSLINFIEERVYVDFITDVKLFLKTSESAPESSDAEEVVASTARSILVSAVATKHDVIEIPVSPVGSASDCIITSAED